MKTVALITAAGKGSRMGAARNKLLLKVGEKTIFEYTLEKFASLAIIDGIVVTASKEDIPEITEICGKYNKPISVVEGADTRTQSVYCGLKAIDPSCEIVLIHDGARPFVNGHIITNCIEDVARYGSAVTAVPVTDTIKRADPATFKITSTLERAELYSVQTPQGFLYKDILKAYSKIQDGESFTDDSAVYEKYIGAAYICMGDPSNIKITFLRDLKAFASEEGHAVKCGIGYDSHRFTAGRKFILGGTEIPFEKGLLGHSDADALTHAVIDSLLSAAALGDIGTHFSDKNPLYKDADSIELLAKVREMLSAEGYRAKNIACVIVCEKPKLAEFIPKMRENLAGALLISPSNIGISAKTDEGMGFAGMGEGIKVYANCLIEKRV